MSTFDEKKETLRPATDHLWIENSGLGDEALQSAIYEIEASSASFALKKAKSFAYILQNGQIGIHPEGIFQFSIKGRGILANQRWRWEEDIIEKYLAEETAVHRAGMNIYGTHRAYSDYGHTSPNSRLLMQVGFAGLLSRIEEKEAREGLSDKQREFYASCKIVLCAMITVTNRLADAIAPYNERNAEALRSIAKGAPKNTYEAMQLLLLYFFMHEFIGATRVRTLGRLDVLLMPFYERDLALGTLTKEEALELLRFFLYDLWLMKVPFDLPFCLGGMDENGEDITSEMSTMIVKAYDSLNIYSPKIHIRVNENTPKDFLLLVLDCIRHGNSSFVFVNDTVGIRTLMRCGITEREARDYVPIGCYEPGVWGVEIACTGNGGVSTLKMVELVIGGGRDLIRGDLCGLACDAPKTFEEFLDAFKAQLRYFTEQCIQYISKIEAYYDRTNPDPLLSAQYEHSVELGVDVYEGGAKYNNSSLYYYGIATCIDALCAVKRLVYDTKRFTLDEMRTMLCASFEGYERERKLCLYLPEKYGNANPTADALTKDVTDYIASICLGKPNGRGGVFKPALFSIDRCFTLGKLTAATPDGRLCGEPFSKNLSATVGMDRNGVTSLIQSVTQIDLSAFPTGSVLDILLHPSAVSGEDGLLAFYGILKTYMKKGGFAMHGNVFDAKVLKAAQANPEKYKNLQVRVCGWNAYFVNLSREEQNAFIKQAEANS